MVTGLVTNLYEIVKLWFVLISVKLVICAEQLYDLSCCYSTQSGQLKRLKGFKSVCSIDVLLTFNSYRFYQRFG